MKIIYAVSLLFFLALSCSSTDNNNAVCSKVSAAVLITVKDSSMIIIVPDSIIWKYENEESRKADYGSNSSVWIGTKSGDYTISIWESGRDTTLAYSIKDIGDEDCRTPDTKLDTIQLQ